VGITDIKDVTWKNKVIVKDWIFVHPKNARMIQSSLARSIYPQYPGMNIGVAHAHMQALTTAPNGKNWLLDVGLMGDPAKMEYKNYSQTAHQNWVSGAAIIHGNDVPELIWGNRL